MEYMMDKLIRNSTAEFLIFTSQSGEDSIEVKVYDESVWLTQTMIAELFDKSRSTITEHLKNIFDSEELEEKSVCRDFRHTEKSSNNSVSSKMETTCKKILQVQYMRD
jgi:hypothetical protein